MSETYISWLAPYLRAYTRLRRATGSVWDASARLLRQFDQYLFGSAHPAPLRSGVLFEYLASLNLRSPRSRDNIVSVVWPALEHARLHGAEVEPLPPRPRPASLGMRLSTPRILSDPIFPPQVGGRFDNPIWPHPDHQNWPHLQQSKEPDPYLIPVEPVGSVSKPDQARRARAWSSGCGQPRRGPQARGLSTAAALSTGQPTAARHPPACSPDAASFPPVAATAGPSR